MENKHYFYKIFEQTVFFAIFLVFFNLDKNNHFRMTLNFPNVWLGISWLSQFYLCKKKLWSLKNISFLQKGAKATQIEHLKKHKKDKWGDSSFVNQHNNMTIQRYALQDSNFDSMANLFIRIGYVLLGPLVFLFYLIRELSNKYSSSKPGSSN